MENNTKELLTYHHFMENNTKEFSNITKHAIEELELFYSNPESQEEKAMVLSNIIELCETFSKQGHSGSSAPYVLNLFCKLAKYEILTPLTGKDEEFIDIQEIGGQGYFQNRRDSRVFKIEGKYWFTEGKVFVNQLGCAFTNNDSIVEIDSFPYTPKTEFINVVEEDLEERLLKADAQKQCMRMKNL